VRGVEEHRAALLEGIEPLAPLELMLLDAHGCTIAHDVSPLRSLPWVDTAALDGYAVRAQDTATASKTDPVRMSVGGDVIVTSAGVDSLPPGQALRVTSGAPLPAGADAVVAMADTDAGIVEVAIATPGRVGANIRPAGADVAEGGVVLPTGTRLGPTQIGLLAALGLGRVSARPRPRVVVIATGSELIEPGANEMPGRHPDVDSYLLATAATQAGATAYRVGMVADDARALIDAVDDQLVRADLVVLTGGVSDRPGEVLRAAFDRNAGIEFVQVAIAPGNWFGHGRIGPDATPLIALPGSPVAAYVGFEAFVRPVIRRMLGAEPLDRPTVRASLIGDLQSVSQRREFMPARLEVEGGRYVVSALGGRGTHQIAALAAANALIVVPEDVTRLSADDAVTVVVLERRTA
jgi:molybdopterin molybdotransferase